MSGMEGRPLVEHNHTAPSLNGTSLRFPPTSSSSSSAAAAASSFSSGPGNVYVYVWLFLGLLLFLLTLLIISLHRLKNIITSSSAASSSTSSTAGAASGPDWSNRSGAGPFTNMEICSISSQRSTVSSLST